MVGGTGYAFTVANAVSPYPMISADYLRYDRPHH